MLDIARWRQDRRDELTELGRRTAKDVLDGGESVRLRPMTPFERKVVHDAVATVKGVSSESEGEEPRRQVVIFRPKPEQHAQDGRVPRETTRPPGGRDDLR